MSEQDIGITNLSETMTTKSETRSERRAISRALYGDIIQFIEFVAVVLVSLTVAYFYHTEVLIIEFDVQLYASAGIIGATFATALLRYDGFYEFDRLLSAGKSIRAVLVRWFASILILIAFAFTLKVSDSYSRIWLFTWTFSTALSLTGLRILASAYLRRAAKAGGVFGRRVAVIGSNEASEIFIENAKQSDEAVTIAGVFPMSKLSGGGDEFNAEFAKLENLVRTGCIDDIVIAARNLERSEMESLIERLSNLPVTVAILSSLHWLDHLGGEIVRIGDAPALTLYRRPLDGWGGVIKTLEDKILGILLFLALSPLMVACAIALKLQSRGPVLFVQKRHGFNNEVFQIYKFRTMTVAEDGDVVNQAKVGDARVTPVGAFLRKWSLDELPQFINVLKGEMSLIGPRPHALAHNDAYAQKISNYSGRHKVKPGITGWAQVNGFRGETSENEQMENRVIYDLKYIDDWSVWFDLKIIVMTIAAVLFPKNAH